jgi:hypothetical protein
MDVSTRQNGRELTERPSCDGRPAHRFMAPDTGRRANLSHDAYSGFQNLS